MITRINLDGFGYINVREGTNLPITFNIQDFKKPFSKSSSYSKEIEIIGDNTTNKILGSAFDINITESGSQFDHTKKVECQVLRDDNIIFDNSYFQLISVNVDGEGLDGGTRISYTGMIVSDLMDFFTQIKGRDLTDLNLTDPTQYEVLNRQNIINSFNNNSTSNLFKYIPLYKLSDPTRYRNNDFIPGIYVKSYWDQIHTEAGFTYEMESSVEDKLDQLIVPYTGEYDPDDTARNESRVDGDDSTFYQYKFGCISTYDPTGNNSNYYVQDPVTNGNELSVVQMNNVTQDNFNQYTPSNSWIYPNFTSKYTITWEFDYDFVIENPDPDPVTLYGEPNDVLNINSLISFNVQSPGGQIIVPNVQTSKINLGQFPVGSQLPSGFTTLSGSATMEVTLDLYSTQVLRDSRVFLEWSANDTCFFSTTGSNTRSVCLDLNVNNTRLTIQPELEYNTGTPIYLQDFIPRDISQRDFIKTFLTMFNLMTTIEDNKIIYTTRDTFYDSGKEVDWTQKLDLKSGVEYEWLITDQAHDLTLSYTEDSDILNEGYLNSTREVYGELEYDFNSDYNVDSEREEIIFSPTPIMYNSQNEMFLPGLPVSEVTDLNIRLLIDGGIREGEYQLQQDSGLWTNTNLTDYPYFGHFDDPISPSWDINFGRCSYYFYNNWSILTDNNLFNTYHRRYFNQLRKGRIMNGYFRLTPLDIQRMELSDKIFINNTWWNIESIIDYDANNDNLTKVRLVTVDDGLSIEPILRVNEGVIDDLDSYVSDLGDIKRKEPYKVNTWVSDSGVDSIVNGSDNIINTPDFGFIIGQSNVINKNGIIMGDNNYDFLSSQNKPNLVVGDNIPVVDEYRSYFGETRIGPDVNVKGSRYGHESIKMYSKYLLDGYVEDGYVYQGLVETYIETGGFEGSTEYNIVSDSINIQGEVSTSIERWVIDLMESTQFRSIYVSNDLRITLIENIIGTPTVEIYVNEMPYTLGDLIVVGDKIDIFTDTNSVIKLKIEK